jgi:hypothetical protein
MLEKVGVHWNDSNEVVAGFEKWKMPVAVLKDHSPDGWRRVKEISPETVLIGRVTPDEGQDWKNAAPTEEAKRAFDRIMPMADRMQGIVDFFIQWNEPIIPNTGPEGREAMSRYMAATVYLTESLKRHGVRSAVGGFAEGNPRLSFWRNYENALRMAMQCDGIAHVHEYDWPFVGATAPWRSFRLGQVIWGNWPKSRPDDPLDEYPGLPPDLFHGLTWAVTEGLIDRGGGIRAGWKTATQNDPDAYIRQVDAYNRFWLALARGETPPGIIRDGDMPLARWDNLLGIAIFCEGDGMWKDYSITEDTDCYDRMADNATPQYYDFGNITPEPPPEPKPPPPPDTIQTRPMVGLHLRNDLNQTPTDHQIIKDAKIEAIKAMTPINAFADVVRTYGFPGVLDGVIRIYESGHPGGVSNFVARHAPLLNDFVGAGLKKVEVLNEPNHVDGIEGWGPTDAHARDFAAWFALAAPTLKEAVPGIEIGFPGLAIPGFVHRDLAWLDICRDAILAHADWLGCHCYWQGDDNRTSPTWGNRHKAYHDRFPTLPIEITEFGDSSPDLTPAEQAWTIERYYKQLEHYPYIRSAHAFIQSSPDPQWALPFSWTDPGGNPYPVVHAVGSYARSDLFQTNPSLLPGYKYIGDRLAQHPTKTYKPRRYGLHYGLDAIDTLVIHHTAIPHTIGAHRIARYHVDSKDFAGIGYHFLQKRNKRAVQTQPMNLATSHCYRQNSHTLGIGVAGMFNRHPPPTQQLEHLADLCADLLRFLPRGTNIAIQGHQEMPHNHSNACPGHTFKKQPPRWLNTLLEMVEARL